MRFLLKARIAVYNFQFFLFSDYLNFFLLFLVFFVKPLIKTQKEENVKTIITIIIHFKNPSVFTLFKVKLSLSYTFGF